MEVIGYPNYKIFIDGRVYSKKNKKFLKYNKTNGYLFVNLFNDGKRKKFKIHRLLGIYYIPNPNKLPCIDHIDGNKENNKLENLRWVSYLDNNRNMTISQSNSMYQGIFHNKKENTYRAGYNINYKRYRKTFKTLEEAIVWRNKMVELHYNRKII